MSHPCDMQWSAPQPPAKFFERASDEILRPMQLRSEPAAKNQQKHARFTCSGACSPLLCFCNGPCYPSARFSGNADFIGVFGHSAVKFPVNSLFLQGQRRTRLEHASCGCVFANWTTAKSIDLSPLDAKKARAFTRCRLTNRSTSFAFLPKRTQRTNPERFEYLIFDL
jgi:hypothetical protein